MSYNASIARVGFSGIGPKSPVLFPVFQGIQKMLNQADGSTVVDSYHTFASTVATKSELSRDTAELMQNITKKIMQRCGPEIYDIVQNEIYTLQQKQHQEQHLQNQWTHAFYRFKHVSSVASDNYQQKQQQDTVTSTTKFLAYAIDGAANTFTDIITLLTSSLKEITRSIVQSFLSTWELVKSYDHKYSIVLRQSVFILCSYACTTFLRESFSEDVAVAFEDTVSKIVKSWEEEVKGDI